VAGGDPVHHPRERIPLLSDALAAGLRDHRRPADPPLFSRRHPHRRPGRGPLPRCRAARGSRAGGPTLAARHGDAGPRRPGAAAGRTYGGADDRPADPLLVAGYSRPILTSAAFARRRRRGQTTRFTKPGRVAAWGATAG